MSNPSSQTSREMTWLHNMATFLAPFVIVAIGGLFTWLQKLDDRQYSMKEEYISKNDFNVAVARLESSIDKQMQTFQLTMDTRHKENALQVDRVLTQLAVANEKLNTLAVDLEKKTKAK